MKLRPVGERALVKPVEQEEKTASGIVLPQTAKDQPQTAKVVTVGEMENGIVSEGDHVLFARFSGTEIKLDDETYLLLNSDDLLGIVEE
ncbi:MAG: co-chaperone GroES [Actinomycetota bacterium]|nr:co-chaperone GroES [Actinomycetota bacterium]